MQACSWMQGCSVSSTAAAQFDLSLFEGFMEVPDLSVTGFKVVIGWPQCPAPIKEAPEMPEGILVVNSRVPLSCGDVLMAHEPGQNVYGQPCGQGRRGKKSSEILRSESVFVTVFVFKAGSVDRVAYGPPDPAG